MYCTVRARTKESLALCFGTCSVYCIGTMFWYFASMETHLFFLVFFLAHMSCQFKDNMLYFILVKYISKAGVVKVFQSNPTNEMNE